MMRWLAPLLPGPQTWVLHDWSPSLTERAIDGPRPVDQDNEPIDVSAQVGQLADLQASDLQGASLVTASALLDVLTSREVHAIVDACVASGCPALLTLSVTGFVELNPFDERDDAFRRAFNAHQLRITDGRRLLGRYGALVARGLFTEAGWHVRSSVTTWRLNDAEPRLLREWLDGWIGAAVEQSPELQDEAVRYREWRVAQQGRGELSAIIRHVDLLACPR